MMRFDTLWLDLRFHAQRMMENEQKARKHEKVAKLGILIRDLQRRKHHPYPWSGIYIFPQNS